jgi:hypothetical protein
MYKAILFSVDGEDFVTDYRFCKTADEVEELLANQGSRWYFYPWQFVIVDNGYQSLFNKRIVSVPMWPEELQELKGKTIRTVQKYLKENGIPLAQVIL